MLEEAKNRNLVSMFDLYGRFALHQEAFKSNDGHISFNQHSQHILFWTSFNVLPALRRFTHISTDERVPPFSDPNLSLIQAEKSFAESTMLSPQSPKFSLRSNRRANRNKTPERLDDGVCIFDDTPVSDVAGSVYQKEIQSMIITLFGSSCQILSDWLAASGCVSETSNSISHAASEWCTILANIYLDGSSDASLSIIDGIIAPFFRLTGQLILSSGNFINLKQIMTKLCNLSFEEATHHWHKTLSTLLSARGQSSVATDLVQCFLDTSYEKIENDTASVIYQLPETFDEIFGNNLCSFLRTFFYSLVSHSQACSLLTDALVERCPEHMKENAHHPLAMFELKCLWLVLNDSKPNRKIAESALNMVRQLDTAVLNEDLQQMIEDFRSQSTA